MGDRHLRLVQPNPGLEALEEDEDPEDLLDELGLI